MPRPFNNHPRIRSPKGVMSCEEIKFWLAELHDNHGWTWTFLGKALKSPTWSLMAKLKKSWIYPGEQIRFSRAIDRILSGELVAVRVGHRCEVHIADHPKPIEQPARFSFNLATGRLTRVKPRPVPPPTLPSFSLAASRAWLPE